MRVERWLGLNDAAVSHLADALDRIPDTPTVVRAALEGLAMVEAADSLDLEQMRNHAERAAETAAIVADPGVSFMVDAGRAFCEARMGDVKLAIAHARTAARLVADMSEREAPVALEGLVLLSATEHWLGDSTGALRHAVRGVELAQATGNLMAELWLRLAAESALTALGRLGSAAETMDDAEQLARTLHNDAATCAILGRRSYIAALCGDMVAARRLAEEGDVYLDLAIDPFLRGTGALALASALVEAGQPERCASWILTSGGGRQLPHVAWPLRSMFFELLTAAELARGDVTGARGWAELAIEAEVPEVSMTRCWGHEK